MPHYFWSFFYIRPSMIRAYPVGCPRLDPIPTHTSQEAESISVYHSSIKGLTQAIQSSHHLTSMSLHCGRKLESPEETDKLRTLGDMQSPHRKQYNGHRLKPFLHHCTALCYHSPHKFGPLQCIIYQAFNFQQRANTGFFLFCKGMSCHLHNVS